MIVDSKHIHLVDDDTEALELLGLLLSESGYQVKLYTSADDFINRYTKNHNECVVLDYKMPGLNGLELFSKLPALGISVPCIFLSGNATIDTAALAMKKGAVYFLSKPVNLNLLTKYIEEALLKYKEDREVISLNKEINALIASLSKKEKEAFALMIENDSISDMAQKMFISENTVEKHRSTVLKKLDFKSTSELSIFFKTNRLLGSIKK